PAGETGAARARRPGMVTRGDRSAWARTTRRAASTAPATAAEAEVRTCPCRSARQPARGDDAGREEAPLRASPVRARRVPRAGRPSHGDFLTPDAADAADQRGDLASLVLPPLRRWIGLLSSSSCSFCALTGQTARASGHERVSASDAGSAGCNL